jgi:hypothetical protein
VIFDDSPFCLLSRVVENEWVKVGPQPPKPNRRGIQLEAATAEANVIWPSVRSSHSATLTRNLKGKTSMLVAAGENKYAKFISGKYKLLMTLRYGIFYTKRSFLSSSVSCKEVEYHRHYAITLTSYLED